MRSIAVLLFSLVTTSSAFAWGLNYSVDSYRKAREIAQENPSKHVLVYYAKPSG